MNQQSRKALRRALQSSAVLSLTLLSLCGTAHADGRRAGSALIFPVHRSGPGVTTVVNVTNMNTAPITPISLGGSTYAHYEYVNVVENQSDAFRPISCYQFDRIEFLTPADTLSVATKCHNATATPRSQGFLCVSAQDPTRFDRDWSHNYLVGSELIIHDSGATYSINAIPFESPQAQGDPTDINQNGILDFNGIEYEGTPDTLIIDSFISINRSKLALINLTGRSDDINTIQLTVWNDNEFPLSAVRPFNCWFEVQLHKISPLFLESFLRDSTPHDPDELDIDCSGVGRLETGWARIDSIGVRTTGGLFVSTDGAMLGAITASQTSVFDAAHLLWESPQKQIVGSFLQP